MTVGMITETLICLRDKMNLTRWEDDAVCAACNILDKLPNMLNENEAKALLAKEKEAKRNI